MRQVLVKIHSRECTAVVTLAGFFCTGNFMNYSNAPGYEPPQTMMQKLQQDRRIRLQEHRRRVLQGWSFVHLFTLLFRFGINKCLKQSKLMYTDTKIFH